MTVTAAAERATPPTRPSAGVRALRIIGWTLITAGLVVALYVMYSLFFTNFETRAVQAELRAEWEETVGSTPLESVDDGDLSPDTDARPSDGAEAAPDLGSAMAMIEFRRPGSDGRPVRDDPVLVVEGVTRDALTRGPGHYPGTALPGENGNFAVAGHRTTYGAPFFKLDELEPGDEVHVTDRAGDRHVYEIVEQRVVTPADAWVLERDPLDRGVPMLTLTTCHPRFSARERLIVFAELAA